MTNGEENPNNQYRMNLRVLGLGNSSFVIISSFAIAHLSFTW
jgi:hypothetical protein